MLAFAICAWTQGVSPSMNEVFVVESNKLVNSFQKGAIVSKNEWEKLLRHAQRGTYLTLYQCRLVGCGKTPLE